MTTADSGQRLRLAVTASNTAGQATATSAESAQVGGGGPQPTPPVNTALPVLTGQAQVGSQLQTSNGSWSGTTPLGFAYAWLRCDAQGNNCQPLAGSSSQYSPLAADVGFTIRSEVTASNTAGSASARSAASAVVQAQSGQAPVNTALPTISGQAQIGSTLTGTNGTWSGAQPISFAYQWQRCQPGAYSQTVLADNPLAYWRFEESSGTQALDSSGNARHGTYQGGVALGSAGALSGSLALSLDGIDDQVAVPASSALSPTRISVEAWVKSKTATWDDYGYFVSKRNSYVLHPNQGSTVVDFVVWVAGTPRTARFTPPGGFNITQWHHYLGTYDGAQVRLYVDGLLSASFAAAGNVAADSGPLAIGRDEEWTRFGAAFIDEVAIYGLALSDARVSAHASGAGGGGSCAAISGATASSYQVTTADSGQRLRLAVTASNTAGQATATSAESAQVGGGGPQPTPPVNTALPVLTGQAQVGSQLQTSNGSWSGTTPLGFAYAWLRCDAQGNNCQPLAGSSSQYSPLAADVGFTIRSEVTASNTAGSASARSAASAVVQAAQGGGTPTGTVVFANSSMRALLVDPSGTAWAYRAAAPSELWKSEDEARTWTRVTGWDAIGQQPWHVAALSSGTLLAAYDSGSSWAIARSTDDGVSWAPVLQLPCFVANCSGRMTTLTNHSFVQGGGDVFLGTYNNQVDQAWTNHVYRSSDDAATWVIAGTTTTHRHIHGLAYDSGRLYVMFGDNTGGGIWYSTDRGATLQPLCSLSKCIAISAIVDPADGDLIFGTDNPGVQNRIVEVDRDTGAATDLLTIPYTSYSSLRAGSTWLIGETHEEGIAITDPNVSIRASLDGGATWGRVYEFPIASVGTRNGLLAVGVFPSGDILLQASSNGAVVLRVSA